MPYRRLEGDLELRPLPCRDGILIRSGTIPRENHARKSNDPTPTPAGLGPSPLVPPLQALRAIAAL